MPVYINDGAFSSALYKQSRHLLNILACMCMNKKSVQERCVLWKYQHTIFIMASLVKGCFEEISMLQIKTIL